MYRMHSGFTLIELMVVIAILAIVAAIAKQFNPNLVLFTGTIAKAPGPDLENAKRVLDAHHHGLDEIKNRIMEYMAMMKLKKESKQTKEIQYFLIFICNYIRFLYYIFL